MKKIFILLMGVFILGCSTDDTKEEEKLFLEKASLTIKSSESVTYKYRVMTALPTESGPQITKQAQHYKVSELVYKDSAIYYLYTPGEGFTGTETVEITNFLHNGAEVYDKEVTTLTIKVTN